MAGIEEPTLANLKNIEYFLTQFKEAGVQIVAIAGNVGLPRADVEAILDQLSKAPVPILVSPGAQENFELHVATIDGGGLRNAIPRESFALVTVAAGQADSFCTYVDKMQATLKAEYHTTDPDLEFQVLSGPTLVDFQITERCHMDCPHCYASSGISKGGTEMRAFSRFP